MRNILANIVAVVVTVTSSLILQQIVGAEKAIRYTPNCFCPSEDKFPPPNSDNVTFATWCGYELGQECDIQRGYICYLNMTNKLARFLSPNCLGAPLYCIPLNIDPLFKTCGKEWQCEKIPSCKNSINATKKALGELRKTYGRNATKFRMPPSSHK
jgi:hypothetical protein